MTDEEWAAWFEKHDALVEFVEEQDDTERCTVTYREGFVWTDDSYYYQSRMMNTCRNWVAKFMVRMAADEWYGIDHWYYTTDSDGNLVHNTLINLEDCEVYDGDDEDLVCPITVGPVRQELSGATEIYQNMAGWANQEGDYGIKGSVWVDWDLADLD